MAVSTAKDILLLPMDNPHVTFRLVKEIQGNHKDESNTITFTTNTTRAAENDPEQSRLEESVSPAQGALPSEYSIPKALLERHSPYWTTMLKDNAFYEGQDLTKTKEIALIPGVLSLSSVCLLVNWLYRNEVPVDVTADPKSGISEMIELARLADYWQIENPDLERHIAYNIKHILDLHNPVEDWVFIDPETMTYEANTVFFTDEHIESVFLLRSENGHALQKLFVQAAVVAYICRNGNDTFIPKIIDKPGVAKELLHWVYLTMAESEFHIDWNPVTLFNDPFSGRRFSIRKRISS